jgi:hypothetical protein
MQKLAEHDVLENEVEADLKRPTTNTITLLLNVEDPYQAWELQRVRTHERTEVY